MYHNPLGYTHHNNVRVINIYYCHISTPALNDYSLLVMQSSGSLNVHTENAPAVHLELTRVICVKFFLPFSTSLYDRLLIIHIIAQVDITATSFQPPPVNLLGGKLP